MGDGIVKSKTIICVLLSIALLNTASAAAEGGVNIEPVVEDTIFSEITHTETTTDLEDWEITMTLNNDAASNNTTFELITQICNNEGVCFAPTTAELSSDDALTFTSAVTTIEDHSYVNWRVKATYADDNDSTEMFPSSGFYKTWSDCWFNDGEWGGDNCPKDSSGDEEDDSFLPALGIIATTGAIMLAAATRFE
jgi:hypothetical protein|tara:strand:+ start:612 stop:1196 length:585 start_codon:yes stop_codon:yes gene_type:complete